MQNVITGLPGPVHFLKSGCHAQNKVQGTDRAFKPLFLLLWAAFPIIRAKISFLLRFMFSCHELLPPSSLQPLRGFATAENNRNAAAQVTFLSPPFKTLPTGKTQPVLLLLHHLGNLLKFTIAKVEGGGEGEFRGVTAEQTSLPLTEVAEKKLLFLIATHRQQPMLPPAVQRQLAWGLHCKHDQLTDLGLKINLFLSPSL